MLARRQACIWGSRGWAGGCARDGTSRSGPAGRKGQALWSRAELRSRGAEGEDVARGRRALRTVAGAKVKRWGGWGYWAEAGVLMKVAGGGTITKPSAVGPGSWAEGCEGHSGVAVSDPTPVVAGGRRGLGGGGRAGGGGAGRRGARRGPPEGGTHVAGGGGGGRRGCLGDGAQLFLGEALGLIERGARVEHRVLDEDAHGAKHEGQE